MKKLTVNEQEELFAQDCKLINLRYEYSGFTGSRYTDIDTGNERRDAGGRLSCLRLDDGREFYV